MKNRRLLSLLSIAVIVVFITSLISTVNVLADDNTPPAPTEEPVQPPTEEPAVEETATEVPAAETESAPTSAPEADPIETPEVDTPAEVIDSAPEGVDVVVLDENGEPMAMVTEEAAQIIMAGDPMWCPDGVTPGTDTLNECTASYSDFATLIANLGSESGSGTIYVAWDYDYTLDGDVVFDHTDGNLDELDNLIIQGGWNFTSDAIDTLQDYSYLGDNTLTITNWVGNVTVNNIFINGANPVNLSNSALSIDTAGNVELNDVAVANTVAGMGIYVETVQNVAMENVDAFENDLEGALIVDATNVTITDSEFSENGYYGYYYGDEYYGADGLDVFAYGLVTLNNVTAYDNALNGAYIEADSVGIFGSAFDGNGWDGEWDEYYYSDVDEEIYQLHEYSGSGLDVYTAGDITINDISADNNAGYGTVLYSETGDITISESSFSLNGYQGDISVYEYLFDNGTTSIGEFDLDYEAGSGLWAEAGNGDITLTNVEANDNAADGALLYTQNGDIQITDSEFIENGQSSGFFDYDYCDGDPFCSDGYDFLEYYLVDEFCDNLPVSYYGTIFNPCEDNDYIEVQGSNFYYSVDLYEDNDGFINEYSISQYGGTGLDAETYNGTVTLNDVDVLFNGGYGAYIYGEDGAVVTNSEFIENGFIGDFELWACASGGLQGGEYNECVSNSGQAVDSGYSASFGYEYGDGLHIDAEGNVTLNQVYAYANGNNGALVHADDNGASVLIQDSEFSYNAYPIYIGGEGGLFEDYLCVEFSTCSGFMVPASEFGLYVDIVEDADSDDGGMDFGMYFNTGDGLEAESDSTLTLTGVLAWDNGGDGAELYSDGGDISVSDSEFSDNGFGSNGYMNAGENSSGGYDYSYSYGYMNSGSGLSMGAEGDVTLTSVTAYDNAMYGAAIYTDSGVFVEESEFSDNGWYGYGEEGSSYSYGYYDTGLGTFVYLDEYNDWDEWYGSGLYIESNGEVRLIEVVAVDNYHDGAEVYSNGGRVIVSCGTYNNNGYGSGDGYGIYEDGASSLELYGPEISNNYYSPDEYFFSGSLVLSDDCTIPEGENKKSELVFAACEGPSDAVSFLLPNGDFVVFPCPINDIAFTQPLDEDELPGALADDQKFLSALKTGLTRDGVTVDENDRPMQVSFLIPEGVDVETLSILYWNGTEWVDLGGEVSEDGLYFEVSTNFVGTFVLVSK
jgi:hypothetical protein